jgi:hypothetical protein
MKSNIIDIARAWWIASSPTPQQSQLAQKRLEICKECDSMVESVVFKLKCNQCGCPIGKKIFVHEMGTCPLQKWNKVEGI